MNDAITTTPTSEKQIEEAFRGSVTVEGAFAMPVFVFAILIFLYFFVAEAVSLNIFRTGLKLSREISMVVGVEKLQDNLTDKLSSGLKAKLGIGSDISSLAAQSIVDGSEQMLVEAYMKTVLSSYSGVLKNVSFDGTGISQDGRFFRLSCRYDVRIPFAMFGMFDIEREQSFCYRLFNGDSRELLLTEESEEDKTDETTVFVTETGTVFHVTRECTHLKLSVTTAEYDEIGNRRSSGGAKYYPCERCGKNVSSGTVYITKDGTRYHASVGCSGLKRTVREMPLEEAEQKYGRCKRCGGQK